MQEKIFADGFLFKRRENAPDFVVGRLSIKAEEAIAFIKKHEKNGWVNLDIKNGRSGNPYIELDTYEGGQTAKPKADQEPAIKESKKRNVPEAQPEQADDDLPF